MWTKWPRKWMKVPQSFMVVVLIRMINLKGTEKYVNVHEMKMSLHPYSLVILNARRRRSGWVVGEAVLDPVVVLLRTRRCLDQVGNLGNVGPVDVELR